MNKQLIGSVLVAGLIITGVSTFSLETLSSENLASVYYITKPVTNSVTNTIYTNPVNTTNITKPTLTVPSYQTTSLTSGCTECYKVLGEYMQAKSDYYGSAAVFYSASKKYVDAVAVTDGPVKLIGDKAKAAQGIAADAKRVAEEAKNKVKEKQRMCLDRYTKYKTLSEAWKNAKGTPGEIIGRDGGCTDVIGG